MDVDRLVAFSYNPTPLAGEEDYFELYHDGQSFDAYKPLRYRILPSTSQTDGSCGRYNLRKNQSSDEIVRRGPNLA